MERRLDWLNIPSRWVTQRLERFRERAYRPTLRVALRYRYVTFAIAFGLFAIALGLQLTKHLPFEPFPKLEGDTVTASVRLPYGAPVEQAERVRSTLENSAKAKHPYRGVDEQHVTLFFFSCFEENGELRRNSHQRNG